MGKYFNWNVSLSVKVCFSLPGLGIVSETHWQRQVYNKTLKYKINALLFNEKQFTIGSY